MSTAERLRRLEEENRRLRARLRRLEGGAPESVLGFELDLLGVPRVRVVGKDGRVEEARLRLRRALRLLAFLATSPGQQAPRAELLEALWPEADPLTIRRNFHPTLSALRRDLGVPARGPQPVEVKAGVYRLSPAFAWRLDTEELVAAAAAGAAAAAVGRSEEAVAAWESGWHLYRGPLLDGMEDQPWIEARREALRSRYLDLLRGLGTVQAQLGRVEAALDAWRALLLQESLEEDAHLAVMRLYARQGRRDLVRRQFDRMENLLREELGVEPRLETALEFQRLLQGGG